MKCERTTCKEQATTTYRDKAGQTWHLCDEHRAAAKRSRA